MADPSSGGASRLSIVREDLWATRVLLRAAWRAALQYRTSFFTVIVGGIAFQGAQLLFIGVLLAKFGQIAGWRIDDIAFLFAVRLAAHAGYVVPAGALLQIDQSVQQGDIDRYLLRPAGIYLQILTRRAPLMALGDALLGFGALVTFAGRASIHWTAPSVLYLVAALIGGGLVETAIQTFISAFTFVTTSTASLRILADDTISRFSGYPLTIFGRYGLFALTFIFPMAFIAYLPVTVLLHRAHAQALPYWIVIASPAAGPILFAFALTWFNRMIRRYSSPGS